MFYVLPRTLRKYAIDTRHVWRMSNIESTSLLRLLIRCGGAHTHRCLSTSKLRWVQLGGIVTIAPIYKYTDVYMQGHFMFFFVDWLYQMFIFKQTKITYVTATTIVGLWSCMVCFYICMDNICMKLMFIYMCQYRHVSSQQIITIWAKTNCKNYLYLCRN